MENNAVGLVHLDLFRRHDDCLLLHIDTEECHGIRLMVEADKVLVVGEKSCIFGILAADRQAEDLFKISVVVIDFKDDHRVIAGI